MFLSTIVRYKFLLSFIILVLISLLDFTFHVRKEHFFRYKYDMQKIENVKTIGEVQIVEASHNAIVIEDPALDLKPKHYYNIEFENGKNYNFTFDNQRIQDQKLVLDYVVWMFSKPTEIDGKATLREVRLPREEKGTINIAFISEDFGCCLMNGKKMRYEWNKINRELKFVGNEKDVFGYGYYGGSHRSTSGLISDSKDIKNNDVIVLWTGRNDGNLDHQESVKNIGTILKNLKENNPNSKIVLLYPAPSPDAVHNNRIEKIVELLRATEFDQDVLEIDLYSFIKNQDEWERLWFYENYGLNAMAYKKIVNYINGEIFK